MARLVRNCPREGLRLEWTTFPCDTRILALVWVRAREGKCIGRRSQPMRATARVSRTLAIGIVARRQALLWQYIQFIYTRHPSSLCGTLVYLYPCCEGFAGFLLVATFRAPHNRNALRPLPTLAHLSRADTELPSLCAGCSCDDEPSAVAASALLPLDPLNHIAFQVVFALRRDLKPVTWAPLALPVHERRHRGLHPTI